MERHVPALHLTAANMDLDPLQHNEKDPISLPGSSCSPAVQPISPRRHPGAAKEDCGHPASERLQDGVSESVGASQSQRYVGLPLDMIPLNMYSRFPRISMAMENIIPDLSTEEVTSTRLSIDEQDIVHTTQSPPTSAKGGRKRKKLHTALHKAISTPSLNLSLRRVQDRLRRAPSITLSGKTLREEAKSTLEEQSQCNLDQVSWTASTGTSYSAHRSPRSSIKGNGIARFQRSSKELLTKAYSRLSAVTERKPEHESCVYQPTPNPPLDETTKRQQPLSFAALKAFDDLMDPAVTSFYSRRTTRDQFARQTGGFLAEPSFVAQEQSVAASNSCRRMLSGSIEELRSNSFLAASHRTFAFSGISLGRPSTVSLDQKSSLASIVRPVTLHDLEDVRSWKQFRQDPLFVDMPHGHQTNFFFPPPAEKGRLSIGPPSLPDSNTTSFRSLHQHQTQPLLIRSTSIEHALERGNFQRKVPLYTPSQIIGPRGVGSLFPPRRSSLSPVNATVQVGDGMNGHPWDASDQHSSTSLSSASKWSTREDRAHGQDSDHPSLRSKDPSITSRDLGPWWKGDKFLTVVKNVIPLHFLLESISGSDALPRFQLEKDDHEEPSRRTCGFCTRHMKQQREGRHFRA